ncbi:hypothetical protein [Aquibacillus salsiterrae]|uniref:Uncharacterized protein n=1 Tax=Aquibacillus salsiterrae TaxID=2950439 RepID=A0A9X3WEY8_9BACI|nr:hypothetical protein [Aquibacillus salsiterrae]MDC3415816.1 hypothetical protein [Aquibacillus salsiterrae]
MKNYRWLLILIMLVPWLTVPLLKKEAIKRFLPATIFITLFVRLENYLADRFTWWFWYKKLHPKVWGELPMNLGPFFVSSLWILKWTYGKFWLYLIVNQIMHIFYAFPIVELAKKKGFVSMVRIKRFQFMLIFLFKALLLYGFQFAYEGLTREKGKRNEQQVNGDVSPPI